MNQEEEAAAEHRHHQLMNRQDTLITKSKAKATQKCNFNRMNV